MSDYGVVDIFVAKYKAGGLSVQCRHLRSKRRLGVQERREGYSEHFNCTNKSKIPRKIFSKRKKKYHSLINKNPNSLKIY